MCKFFLANACERGDRCAYAHSRTEMRATPDLRCTQFCPTASSGKPCYDAGCKFAHCRTELKQFPGGNSHKEDVGSRHAAASLMLAQASLAAMAAQQAPIVTPSLTSNALMNGIQGANVFRQDLASLMQAQTAISQALVNLEERLRASSSENGTGSHASDSEKYSDAKTGIDSCIGLAARDEGAVEFGLQVEGLKPCWPESDQATDSFSRQSSWDEASEGSEPDIAWAVADVGIAFGKQISDFGPVFSRQVSYKHEAERKGRPAASPSNIHDDTNPACDSTGLCIKNTFYTLIEEEPTRTSCRRSSSVPARFVSGSAARQTASVNCDSATEASQQASKRHIQATRVKPEARHAQSPRALNPLPDGPSQAGPVLLGRKLVGTGRNDFQVRKEHSNVVQAW